MLHNVLRPPKNVAPRQDVEVHTAPPGLPAVPHDLDFGNDAQVLAMHRELTEALERQPEWASTVDGDPRVAGAFASLILHRYAAARQAAPDAIPDAWQAAQAIVAAHLSPTGNEELRRTLATDAAPQGIFAQLGDSGRLCLTAQVCHRDADAHVLDRRWALAVSDYATAKLAYAQVPGSEATVKELDRLATLAQAQANQQNQHVETKLSLLWERAQALADQPEAAAPIYMKIGRLTFEHHVTLDDVEALQATLQDAAKAFAAASARYTDRGQTAKALDADLRAAHALDCGLQYQKAAALYTKVKQGLLARQDVHKGSHGAERADIDAHNAKYAEDRARAADIHRLLYRTAVDFAKSGQDAEAAKSYESLAWMHQRAGQPVQAGLLLRLAQACHVRVAQRQMTAAQDFAAQGKYARAGHIYADAQERFRLADQPQQAQEAKEAKKLAYARAEAQSKLFEQLAQAMGAHTTKVDQNQPGGVENTPLVNRLQQLLREFPDALP
ncbi:hypothetical protein [Pandoraea oxalativorans]|uniref:Uncharacterized protein n=1 Tax=Pandoraea oxalativorans TaxID=573737 RepID=A0A0G3IE53_9BURK|nr:hypothetical protein [Pandoraea oxalativorans]AKK24833.1 hypothetical protein MB84_29085 [Pandoraea oxalativorans]